MNPLDRSTAIVPSAKITLLGCGKMGFALLSGWTARGVPATSLQVIEPDPSIELSELAARSGVTLVEKSEAEPADVLVVALKPQAAPSVAAGCGHLLGEDSVVVSIMAGITVERLRELFPAAASVVRTMPNLAAMVGESASVLIAGQECSADHRNLAEALLNGVGSVEWLPDEAMVDAASGVSGSGPAYVFYLVECLAAAGVRSGLPAETAARLARTTIQGAGAVLSSSDETPSALRRDVTSPGGTTEAGLKVLMKESRLQALLDETVEAAARRSRELGAMSPPPSAAP